MKEIGIGRTRIKELERKKTKNNKIGKRKKVREGKDEEIKRRT